MKTIWAIAGSDSLSCSGMQADLRVAQVQGVHCASIVTCTTAQNHDSCTEIKCVGGEHILEQYRSLQSHGSVDAIKIGMIPSLEALQSVRRIVTESTAPVVFDPVLSTSSGLDNLNESHLETLKDLIQHVTVLTPNSHEAALILGYSIETADDMRRAAKDFKDLGCKAVLLKGGHLASEDDCTDYYSDENRSMWLTTNRLEKDFRGTGCYLSTSIACAIAKGMNYREAVVDARIHLMEAMDSAYALGGKHVLSESKTPQGRPQVEEENEFPSLGATPIGFYPVVPNAAWLKRLLPLGVSTAQLRIKNVDEGSKEAEIKEAIELGKQYNCRLFINDYWELAIKHGAYGVHLGQEDLDDADCDKIRAAGLRLGISTHSVEELERANQLKPSYVALGPIFETTCKSMAFGPQGIDRVGEWIKMTKHPLVAIGGLKPEHAPELLRQGASGCALISDVLEAPDPESRAKEWIRIMGN